MVGICFPSTRAAGSELITMFGTRESTMTDFTSRSINPSPPFGFAKVVDIRPQRQIE